MRGQYFPNKTNNSLNKLIRRIVGKRNPNEWWLQSLLKKCPNIREVIVMGEVDKSHWKSPLGASNSVLSVIGRYCPNIKSLTLNCLFAIQYLDFFLKYGHKLEELVISQDMDQIKKYLKLCPNLKKLKTGNPLAILKQDFLTKLEYFGNFFSGYTLQISSVNMIEFETFTNRYNETMKILNIRFGYLTAEELKTCLQYISRFENLRQLEFIIEYLYLQQKTEPIDDCLSLIGQKCNKLLKFTLDLSIAQLVPISDQFFDIFTNFKAIRKLKITLKIDKALKGSVECFKHCKQLNDIDISYKKLPKDFFINIKIFVPKLQLLKISTDNQFSDSFIDSFHPMKCIQKVELHNDWSKYDDYKIWYFGKCLSEVMFSPNGMNVKRINDNCGLINYYHYYKSD